MSFLVYFKIDFVLTIKYTLYLLALSELEIKNKVRHCHSSVSIYKM